jgi:hypothetical protein
MSLDVYLEEAEVEDRLMTVERALDGRESVWHEVYDANITHNLTKMAAEAGIYEQLWRPDEIGITRASQLIEPLREGLAKMKADPERFKAFNPPNGWGSYDAFIPWIERYLAACENYPNARVRVWR